MRRMWMHVSNFGHVGKLFMLILVLLQTRLFRHSAQSRAVRRAEKCMASQNHGSLHGW